MKAKLSVIAHIPLLRIEEPTVEFNGMHLWRMPFEVFDGLTFHAFRDFRAEYDATAPVWLRMDGEIEPAGAIVETWDRPSNSIDIKLDRMSWRSTLQQNGLAVIAGFHEKIVARVWSALALAAPAAMPPWPMTSVTYAQLGDGYGFAIGADTADTLQLRGEADLDLLFHPQLAGAPLGMEAMRRMAGRWDAVEAMLAEPALSAALRSLMAASHFTLTPEEQSALATVALEALLLPEVRSGLGATLSRRLAMLLAHDVGHGERLRAIAAALYDARSAGLHGGDELPEVAASVASAQATQLLAASIVALHERRVGDATQAVKTVCEKLDASPNTGDSTRDASLPHSQPDGLRAPWRLASRHETHSDNAAAASTGVDGIDGRWLVVAPLIGLGVEHAWNLDADPASPAIAAITGNELLSLEGQGVRREIAASLSVSGHRIAAFAFESPDAGDPTPAYEAAEFRRLLDMRDNVVLALRLAGIEDFIDPELLGCYVRRGGRTLREPTVLRQSVLSQALSAPRAMLGSSLQEHTTPAWRLISRYTESPRHPELEQACRLFRRVHDRLFLPEIARLQLCFSLIDSLLGRFREMGAALPLEQLVARMLGNDLHPAAHWFATQARGWRNDLGQGRVQLGDEARSGAHLLVIARAALTNALVTWLEQSNPRMRPGPLLIHKLSAG